ncbi:MAG: hypothetical protein M3R59_09015 [Verrucomicrobiota bacterium]|nr:hypothetical protein [Verrucomicrobiota bacterium]
MSTWIEPPPQKSGLGCVGKGCLIVIAFVVFLMIAAGVGLFIGFKSHSALVRGAYWARKTQVIAEEPVLVPKFETTSENIAAAERKWEGFADADGPAHVELSADDLNNLAAGDDDLRDRVFASIDGDHLRVQASLPLAKYVQRSPYFLNGDIEVQLDGRQSLSQPHFLRLIVNKHAAPTDFLDWKYRGKMLRDYEGESKEKEGAWKVEIRDGLLIFDKTSRS